MTLHDGRYAIASPDGRDLYYSKDREPGIWRVALSGGEETKVVGAPVFWQGWSVGRHGLYYASSESVVLGRREKFTIQCFDFETGRTTVLFRKEGPEQHQSMTVSPDEQWILFSEAPAGHQT